MARDINTIYSSIITTKNSRSELDDLNSTSKSAIYKLWAYITSVAIYSHELLWDLFRDEINLTLTERINGTSPWYANKALEYQDGDELISLGDITYLGYDPILLDNRIITRCSYYEDLINYKGRLNLKVAKGQPDSLSELDIDELGRVIKYFEKIKFAGTNINIISIQADEIFLDTVTIYHDGVRTDEEINEDVNNAMDAYLVNLPFDGQFYIQSFIDAIQLVENVIDVYVVALSIKSYLGNPTPTAEPIVRKVLLDAGYAKIARGELDPVINIEIE